MRRRRKRFILAAKPFLECLERLEDGSKRGEILHRDHGEVGCDFPNKSLLPHPRSLFARRFLEVWRGNWTDLLSFKRQGAFDRFWSNALTSHDII